MSKITKIIVFIAIVFLSATARLWMLDKVPAAISDDEIDFVLDAKSIYLSGKDLSQTWFPYFLTSPPFQYPKSELSSLLMSGLVGPGNLSLFSARLPYAIWGILMVIALVLAANQLFNWKVAVVTGIIASINPWAVYFYRTSYDAPLSTVLYLFALAVILAAKGKWLFGSIPLLFLAFYSYIGSKLILIPWTLITTVYSWKIVNKERNKKRYLFMGASVIIIFAFWVISLKANPSNQRVGQVLTPFHPKVSSQVDIQRRLSLVSPFSAFFTNKITVYSNIIFERYLKILSTDFLFLHGEGNAVYSTWYHGMFYYLDFIFMLIGFVLMFKKEKFKWYLLVTLASIAPLPALLHAGELEVAHRGALLYPLMIIFIGYGLAESIYEIRWKWLKLGVVATIAFLYLLQAGNFFYIYLFRNPVYNSEGFGFSGRILSRYLNLASRNGAKITVITESANNAFKQYLFYNDLVRKENLRQIGQKIRTGDYQWQNVGFTTECSAGNDLDSNHIRIYNVIKNCDFPGFWITIPQLADGGEVYRIYGDNVCRNYELPRYPSSLSIEDLEVEKLTEINFCRKYITNLSQ